MSDSVKRDIPQVIAEAMDGIRSSDEVTTEFNFEELAANVIARIPRNFHESIPVTGAHVLPRDKYPELYNSDRVSELVALALYSKGWCLVSDYSGGTAPLVVQIEKALSTKIV